MKPKTPTLKPCPFCGSFAVLCKHEFIDRWWVECSRKECHTAAGYWKHSVRDAASIWNKRVKPKEQK